MKVGLYYEAGNGSANWHEFLAGNLAMSGTNSQQLWLAHYLGEALTSRFIFFTTAALHPHQFLQQQQVANESEAVSFCAAQEIDILILNGKLTADIISAIGAAETVGIELIVWLHNPPHPELQNAFVNYNCIKRLVAVSEPQYHSYRHFKWFDKLCVVHNGVHLPENVPPPPASFTTNPVIGFMGAINEAKGFHWVCKAWPAIRNKFPEATLKVMGSVALHHHNLTLGETGVAEPEFEAKWIHPFLGKNERERIANGVILYGNCSPNPLSEIVPTCHIGIVNPNRPPHHETFCLSALEFQKYGVPVIGGKQGGLVETVLHGKTGWLISNPNTLAEAVLVSLCQIQKFTLTPDNYKQHAARFSIQRTYLSVLQLLQDVRNERPPQSIPLRPPFVSLNTLAKSLIALKQRR